MTWGLLFLALSPSVYMMTPQLTEQYGQVLRVSVVRASLKLRTCARTACGENPIIARLEPPSPAPQTLKNCLLFMSIEQPPLVSMHLPALHRLLAHVSALRARACERR